MRRRFTSPLFISAISFVLSSSAWGQFLNSEIIAVSDPPVGTVGTKILFFGHQENNHHSPIAVFEQLEPVFQAQGISLVFTDRFSSLTTANLASYDALMMTGNARSGFSSTTDPFVTIIQQYVRNGGSLIGIHVASAAFRFDPRFASLLGGRFQSHTTGRFTPETLPSSHPISLNLPPLDSFDETYILKDLNPDITVLQERVKNDSRFPWTWTRREGPGLVFYTASGHVPASGQTGTFDSIIQNGFHELLLRGSQWATRRHFSSFTQSGLLASGKIVGHGNLRSPNTPSYWMADIDGPALFSPEDQLITIGGEEFHFKSSSPLSMIPCPGDSESIVFSRDLVDSSENSLKGLWLLDKSQAITPILVEQQPYLNSDSAVLVEKVNPETGEGFVANGNGQILARVILNDPSHADLRSALFLSGDGSIIREGDSHPSLATGVTFSDLSKGPLSLNSNHQFAATVKTSEGNSALARWTDSALELPVMEGKLVPGFTDLFWGEILHLKINNHGDIGAIVTLSGNITPQTDTALLHIPRNNGRPSILLREGQSISGLSTSTVIGDLALSPIIMDHNGNCFLTSSLQGPLVSTQNDSALLRAGSATNQLLAREGDTLPAISPSVTMGSQLSQSTLSITPSGDLYFKASKVDEGLESEALFKIENQTVFEVAATGDLLKRAGGQSFEIASMENLLLGGSDDGLPSQSSIENTLVLTALTTSGHRALARLQDLDDLDQDGLANSLEAGLGLDPHTPSTATSASFPSIRELSGQSYYTYLRPRISGLPSPKVQQTTDLENWTTHSQPPIIWNDQDTVPPNFERVGILLTETHQKKFFRLAF